MTNVKSLRSSHLIVSGRARSLILISITIRATIVVLILRSLERRRGRLDEATKASLSSSNTTDTSVHLIHLNSECIKASIHALKLCHDRLEGHTTCRRRSRCGWSGRSWRSHHLGLWPLWSKLGLTPSNSRRTNGTHHEEVRRVKIEDRHMAKNPHDSKMENKLITGHRIPIDIYKGEYEVRGKVYGNPLNKE